MERCRTLNADERALLELLLHEVGPRVFAYVRKAFGNRVEAEDVLAETFARAADNIRPLRAHARPDLYLIAIARNLCLDTLRRRQPDRISDGQACRIPTPEISPHEQTAAREERRRLRDAVAELPSIQREVVVLRLSAELKFEEIAELLSIPLGTALSRMNAATVRLRKELGYGHACGKAC